MVEDADLEDEDDIIDEDEDDEIDFFEFDDHPISLLEKTKMNGEFGRKIHLESMMIQWDKVVRGSLPNGFKYVLLNNNTPPERMEAYLQVDVGSVDELEDQQGLGKITEESQTFQLEIY